jgi:hypothetical protein
MNLISRNVHGILDCLVGAVLMVSPWMLGFADNRMATHVFIVLGIAPIIYSLFTDYEWSAARLIPFRVHLMLDTLSGITLIISPWLFGFADRITWPHVSFGILELLVVMLTSKAPNPRPSRPNTYP